MSVLKSSGLIADEPTPLDNTKFPYEETVQLLRLQLNDTSEVLTSVRVKYGLTKLGTVISQTLDRYESYDEPVISYKYVNSDPNSKGSKTVRIAYTTGNHIRKYTLPFSAKEVNRLVAQGKAPNQPTKGVSLGIKKENFGTDYNVDNLKQFMERPFDELYEEKQTPRFRLDRSLHDNLEAAHIT